MPKLVHDLQQTLLHVTLELQVAFTNFCRMHPLTQSPILQGSPQSGRVDGATMRAAAAASLPPALPSLTRLSSSSPSSPLWHRKRDQGTLICVQDIGFALGTHESRNGMFLIGNNPLFEPHTFPLVINIFLCCSLFSSSYAFLGLSSFGIKA